MTDLLPTRSATTALWIASVLLFHGGAALAEPEGADDFGAAVASLSAKSFRTKGAAVESVGRSNDPRARRVLEGLLDGRLRTRRDDSRVVLIRDAEAEPAPIEDAATGDDLGEVELASLKKIVVNNKMRRELRAEIARLSLEDGDPEGRRAAVMSLLGALSDETVALLRQALVAERNAGVQDAIRVALALHDLDDPDPARQVGAIEALRGNMRTEVHNRLTRLVETEPSGAALDPAVREAAIRSLASIDRKRAVYGLAETAFFGLSLGFVLVLAAIGLAITFGVMGVINMAHGELIMLGAYSTYVVQQAMPEHLELSLFAAIPVAFLVSATVGIAIERGLVRHLYGRPLETLLATFGVSLFLQQAVRSLFSPLNRAVSTPEWMSGQWILNDALALTYNRLFIILFSAIVFGGLVSLLNYTTLGLQIRAVAQNRDMARAMGIRGGWIDAATFGLGSGVAGLAGVALSQLTNVGPNLGQAHIVDSFMVVVFGGVGNLWGTLVAGLTLGMTNKFLEPFAGAVLAKILVLVFIILFIQRRPQGLFPQRGRAAEA